MTIPMGHSQNFLYQFHQPTKQRQNVLHFDGRNPSRSGKPKVFTVRLQRSSGTLGLQLRGLDVVTWSDFNWEVAVGRFSEVVFTDFFQHVDSLKLTAGH